MENTKIALVQEQPVHLDLKASLDKALILMETAATGGATVIAFAELWLPGYPAWIDYCPNIGTWDDEGVKSAWAKLYQNSLEIDGPEMKALQEKAATLKVIVAIGFHEVINSGKGNSTIYNSFVIINKDGAILNHHRKLMPTYNEKLIHGLGDGHGLKSVDTDAGKLGGLICWEHWMPLSRQALHDEGEDIHFAFWPAIKERHLLASRHYAFEGRCFVIAIGQIMQVKDMPESLTLPKDWTDPEMLVLDGGSCIIGPDGNYLLEPQSGERDIYYFNLPSRTTLLKERMNLATSGHYQRHDVFQLTVNKKRL